MCHSSTCGGHFATRKTTNKILHSGFYWPTIFKDAHCFYTKCLQCQAALNISKQDEMPTWSILEVEIFNVWGIDFMGPFPPHGKEYILIAVDYVSPLGQTTIERCSDLLQDAFSPDTDVRGPSSATEAHTSLVRISGHYWRDMEYTIASPLHTTLGE